MDINNYINLGEGEKQKDKGVEERRGGLEGDTSVFDKFLMMKLFYEVKEERDRYIKALEKERDLREKDREEREKDREEREKERDRRDKEKGIESEEKEKERDKRDKEKEALLQEISKRDVEIQKLKDGLKDGKIKELEIDLEAALQLSNGSITSRGSKSRLKGALALKDKRTESKDKIDDEEKEEEKEELEEVETNINFLGENAERLGMQPPERKGCFGILPLHNDWVWAIYNMWMLKMTAAVVVTGSFVLALPILYPEYGLIAHLEYWTNIRKFYLLIVVG